MAHQEFNYKNSLKNTTSYPFIQKYVPIDRFIILPLASLVVRMVYRTSITPNQLTFSSFVIGIISGLTYLGGQPLFFALGGTLALISLILDCADGMLARAKNMSSRYGAFLDLFMDRVVDFVVLGGITWGLYFLSRDWRHLVFGFLTIALYFLQTSLFYLINNYQAHGKLGEAAEAKIMAVFILFLLSLIGRLDAILATVFVMACISTIIKTIRAFRWGKNQSSNFDS